jgi:hypothetical protein
MKLFGVCGHVQPAVDMRALDSSGAARKTITRSGEAQVTNPFRHTAADRCASDAHAEQDALVLAALSGAYAGVMIIPLLRSPIAVTAAGRRGAAGVRCRAGGIRSRAV